MPVQPARRSRRAPLATLAAAAAATGVLTACEKPLPQVTVVGAGRVVTVAPSSYCFDTNSCRKPGANRLAVVTVPADEKILVDVPRAVKSRGWQVRALSLTDDGKQIGSSGPITDSHSYKVTSGAGGGAPFIVEVDQLRNGQADGSKWSFLVSVSTTGS
jgi:hypothetical protein